MERIGFRAFVSKKRIGDETLFGIGLGGTNMERSGFLSIRLIETNAERIGFLGIRFKGTASLVVNRRIVSMEDAVVL